MHIHHMFDGLQPQVSSDDFGPSMGCMQEEGVGVFGDVLNMPFSNPILVVCSDPAEGDCLMCCPNVIHKSLVREPVIITMVVLDSHSMLFSQTFECMFCIDCLVCCEVVVHVDISEITSMIHKHRGSRVLADGRWVCQWDFRWDRTHLISPYILR